MGHVSQEFEARRDTQKGWVAVIHGKWLPALPLSEQEALPS